MSDYGNPKIGGKVFNGTWYSKGKILFIYQEELVGVFGEYDYSWVDVPATRGSYAYTFKSDLNRDWVVSETEFGNERWLGIVS